MRTRASLSAYKTVSHIRTKWCRVPRLWWQHQVCPVSCRYVFADLYGKGFTGLESPADSGNFTMSRMSFLCAGAASPMTCGLKGQDLTNDLQYIFSFGEDTNRDLYLLTLAGVFRVTSGDKCGITSCSQNVLNGTAQAAPAPALAPTLLGGSGASTGPQVISLVIVFLSLIALTL